MAELAAAMPLAPRRTGRFTYVVKVTAGRRLCDGSFPAPPPAPPLTATPER
jgi:hypothetical protein